MSGEDYKRSREGMRYYDVAAAFVLELGPVRSILEVGPYTTPFLSRFAETPVRMALDMHWLAQFPGVIGLQGDFMSLRITQFEVVCCLQVLEHVEDPARFAVRLLSAASRRLVVSVPFHWPAVAGIGHKHDCIDDQQMATWFGRGPDKRDVVGDAGCDRLVLVYDKPPVRSDR